MAKVFVKNIDQDPYLKLYRDPKTGIAWIEDGHAGVAHSCHPNISSSGSVAQMKRKGWWSKNDRTVRSHGFIYNIDLLALSTDLDQVACDYCQCGGKHTGRPNRVPGGKKRHGVDPYAVHVWDPGNVISQVTGRYSSKRKAVKMAKRHVARHGTTARAYADVGGLKRLWASDVATAGGKRRHAGAKQPSVGKQVAELNKLLRK